MWDPDPLAATDAELHVTEWANELRTQTSAEASDDAEASAAARLRDEHTLTWAVCALVADALVFDATRYADVEEFIFHVRNTVTLAPNYGPASFVDNGDELSLAYLVVLRADVDELNHVICATSTHRFVESFDGGELCERCGQLEESA